VAATVFFVLQRPILNDIRGHSDPKNICQVAGNRIYFFQNFLGRPPPALVPSAFGSGLRPLTGPPFPKFLDPPLLCGVKLLNVVDVRPFLPPEQGNYCCGDVADCVCVTLMYCAQTTESIIVQPSPDCNPAILDFPYQI